MRHLINSVANWGEGEKSPPFSVVVKSSGATPGIISTQQCPQLGTGTGVPPPGEHVPNDSSENFGDEKSTV